MWGSEGKYKIPPKRQPRREWRSMASSSEMPKYPGQIIRDAVEEPQPDESLWDGIKKNSEKFIEGLAFSVGFHRVRTWFMILATAIATFCCSEFMFNLQFNTSLSIVAVGTVFPVVFSINAAYQNREKALRHLDEIKSGLIYTYFIFGQWDAHHAGNTLEDAERVMCKLTVDIIKSLKACPEDPDEEREVHEITAQVYDSFQAIIEMAHRNTKVPPPVVNGLQMMLRGMMCNFTSIKTIKDMETPKGLRHLCFFLIIMTPILLGPYWAHFCRDGDHSDLDFMDYGCAAAYFIGLLYVIISSTLLRVQECLEDPFDGDGEDDINWQLFCTQMDKLPLHGVDGPELRKEEARLLEEELAAKKATEAAEGEDKEKKAA